MQIGPKKYTENKGLLTHQLNPQTPAPIRLNSRMLRYNASAQLAELEIGDSDLDERPWNLSYF